jgi:ABC transport system ATP-binding/permease protein
LIFARIGSATGCFITIHGTVVGMPIVTLDHVSVAYGHLPLLDDIALQVEARERVSLIGRNGSGKSTLLRIIHGDMPPDAGSIWRQPGLRVARLEQDVRLSAARPVFDVVADGLGGSEVEQHWRVDRVLSHLGLSPDPIADTLSGGEQRRVLLARALVSQPDLLLLDEPTNHLDIAAITWLEGFLVDYPGAVMFVTHDRAFLQRVATRIVELDRGRLLSWPGDYADFLRKKEAWLANEVIQQAKFDKRLTEEEAWLRQGVKARRTRNEGRVKALLAMREDRAARRVSAGAVRLRMERSDPSGQLVFEAEGVSKSFADKIVVRDFTTRVMRGDRIGLIGPNGTGKTTALRLLLGEIEPDSGSVRHGANVQIAYYDQQREQLDPERTVFDTVGDGNDTVVVNGQPKHVHGYLSDFLFAPERARSPVKALSGGERNRLLIARLLTRPANVLVLDEPTNDLDLETLELLEAQLLEWTGTLLLVSHDRVFLDNVVTSTLVFDGDGRVQEFVGGYEDWLRQRSAEAGSGRSSARQARRRVDAGRTAPSAQAVATSDSPSADLVTPPRKLSFKEQRELEALPARIEALETEERALNAMFGDSGFYAKAAETIRRTLARLEEVRAELAAVYARWDELDSRKTLHHGGRGGH